MSSNAIQSTPVAPGEALSAESRLEAARKAWGALQQAEGQVARLLGYNHPSLQMRQDRYRWERQRDEARAQLQQALAIPRVEQYGRGESNYAQAATA